MVTLVPEVVLAVTVVQEVVLTVTVVETWRLSGQRYSCKGNNSGRLYGLLYDVTLCIIEYIKSVVRVHYYIFGEYDIYLFTFGRDIIL